jgi:hypothetical protein
MNKFIKTGISLASAAVIAASAATTSFAVNYLGDVNNDGSVNSADALMILSYSVGLPNINIDLKKADVNGDGAVNSMDALNVLKISVGLQDKVEYTDEDEDEQDPLSFSKAEIINYYNSSLQKAYASEKVTIAKTKTTSVVLSKFSPAFLKSLVNSLIAENTGEEKSTKTFKSNAAEAEAFLVPTALEADGASSAVIAATANGYKVTITLVSETVDYKTDPKYNAQASCPLTGIAEMAEKNNVTVSSSSLNYVGTVITAEIDKSGNILSLNHNMNINVSAKGKYGSTNVEGSGSGKIVIDAKFTY